MRTTSRNAARLPAPPDPLTAREREVAALVAHGWSNRVIAAELVVSQATVAKHIEHILAKLGFTSRVEIGVRMASSDSRPRVADCYSIVTTWNPESV